MSDVVETVARAIAGEDWQWKKYLPQALAAIKAYNECLMVPSWDMLQAGALELCDSSADPVEHWHDQARDVWRDMLLAQETYK